MANHRIPTSKQVHVLAAIAEGMPINAVCRMFGVGKHGVLRVIRETGEALADYMDKNFRELCCYRVAMDEAWQFVGCHSGRMKKREVERGDFWLWAAIDSDSKLLFSHRIGSRNQFDCRDFIKDAGSRG